MAVFVVAFAVQNPVAVPSNGNEGSLRCGFIGACAAYPGCSGHALLLLCALLAGYMMITQMEWNMSETTILL